MATLPITAIIAFHNEEDIIEVCTEVLVSQGINVHLIDDNSTDGSRESLDQLLRSELVTIEEPAPNEGQTIAHEFNLTNIVTRKEQLSADKKGEWIINHDADEFREGPWFHLNLRESIELVDELGYNAIDFRTLDFLPTKEGFEPGNDPRGFFRRYRESPDYNRLQIRCWKQPEGVIDLASTGGHETVFVGRKVFPIKFLLRHYPIRGREHGRRKVFEDRLPALAKSETDIGWHKQFDDYHRDGEFLRSAEELTEYDPQLVKVQLQLDAIAECRRDTREQRIIEEGLARLEAVYGREMDRVNRENLRLQRELDERNHEIIDLHAKLDAQNRRVMELESKIAGNAEAEKEPGQ